MTRIRELATVVDLATAFNGVEPERMVAASDGSLWILETGRGRIIRVDPLTGSAEAVYRAGQQLDGGVAGDPWLIATAATDVVVVDRDRQAWRADLIERVMRRMPLAGIETLDAADLAAHRPPASAPARDLQPVRGRRRERDGVEVDAAARHPGHLPRRRPSRS